MAIIRTAALLADIRGSVAGVTFTRSRAGAVARARRKPCEATTAVLSQQRALWSVKVDHWRRVLTNANRLQWNTIAGYARPKNKLGQEYTPTGFQLFMALTQPTPGDPHPFRAVPYPPYVTPAFPLILTWNEATNRIDVETSLNFVPPYDGYLHVWYSKSTPPSHYYFSGAWTWSHKRGYATGVPMDFRLINEPPAYRPCRMFAKIRTFRHWYTPSAAMIYSISIPPEP